MGCCVFNNTKQIMTHENSEKIIINENISKINKSQSEKSHIYLDISTKEEINNSSIFPSSLVKSKDNPNGIVVLKMKNWIIVNINLNLHLALYMATIIKNIENYILIDIIF